MTDSPPTAYVNGQYLPREQAALSIEDRGTLFADGVYEVLAVHAGQPFVLQPHLDRMRRSLDGIAIPAPEALDQLQQITHQLIERSGIADGIVYWQITRGTGPRQHLPADDPAPSLVAIIYPKPAFNPDDPPLTRTACLQPDHRWTQCWIKTLMLLPNTLALRQARASGADEAILHRDGRVTEASASNVMIVRERTLITPPADQWILPGITRQLVLELAANLDIPVQHTAFTTDELRAADEVLLTGTTTHVTAISHVDARPIGQACAGPITEQLYQGYCQHLANACGLTHPAG